jgi:hypothetical protein
MAFQSHPDVYKINELLNEFIIIDRRVHCGNLQKVYFEKPFKAEDLFWIMKGKLMIL